MVVKLLVWLVERWVGLGGAYLREVFVLSERGITRERMVKRLKIWVEREKKEQACRG